MTTRLLLLAVVGWVWASADAVYAAGQTDGQASAQVQARFHAAFPAARYHKDGTRITRVFGRAFGSGGTPVESAEGFQSRFAGLFGVATADLQPVSLLEAGRHVQPVMYDRDTGRYKFTLVYYSQYKDGIPVFRADLRLLVRNEPGYPLVLAASALRDLGDFAVDVDSAQIPEGIGQPDALELFPGLASFTQQKVVIWAGVDDMEVEPAVAVTFVGESPFPEKWLFVVDAVTGEILYKEDLILEVDVAGNVSGLASEGPGADFCEAEVLTPMPYSRVNIVGGSTAFADENGDFVIPNGGGGSVTVDSPIRGQWFRVESFNLPDTVLSMTVTPPGPADFVHNASNTSETVRAEVNGYVQANIVRDFTLFHSPDYPTIGTQEDYLVSVNRTGGICPGNAQYTGNAINFCLSGGGAPNTAWSSVVYHEYGHHLVAMAGSGQGAYGEGMGDVMSVLILDDPRLGLGFFGSCATSLRNADNTCQYLQVGCSTCGSAIHSCGQLLSGSVWSTRNELALTNPFTYIDILAPLAIDAMLLHSGSSITPSITIDYLTLDDDDGDIDNGTPHHTEICAGFGAHDMDCPPLLLLEFQYPDGLPESVPPNQPVLIGVNVLPFNDTPVPGTGEVSYRIGGGGFTTVPMDEINPNEYEATLPGADCDDLIDYYFSAQAAGGATVSDPYDAPSTTFVVLAATNIVTVADYDFETDPGWSVSGNAADGQWNRGIPVDCSRGDPPADQDGSGQCWLTDNSAANGCNSDVDDGSTTLTSQVIDLSGLDDPRVSYARWFSNDFGNDPNTDTFVVEVSSNGGGSWVNLETVGPSGGEVSGGWFVKEFHISDFVSITSEFRIRFTTSDTASQPSVVEAAIDAFSIVNIECGPSCTDGALNQGEDRIDCGGPCPPCECLSDGACTDGVFCNGDETCDDYGTCQSPGDPCTDPDFPHCNEAGPSCDECATELHCDDDADCTVNECQSGSCTYTPNDGLCDDGDLCTTEVCDPESPDADEFGCVPTANPQPYGDIQPVPDPPATYPCDAEELARAGDGFLTMLDVMCAFNAMNDGAPYANCPCADVNPCGGDNFLTMLDVMSIFNTMNDPASAPCPDPCP